VEDWSRRPDTMLPWRSLELDRVCFRPKEKNLPSPYRDRYELIDFQNSIGLSVTCCWFPSCADDSCLASVYPRTCGRHPRSWARAMQPGRITGLPRKCFADACLLGGPLVGWRVLGRRSRTKRRLVRACPPTASLTTIRWGAALCYFCPDYQRMLRFAGLLSLLDALS
jgi:hypothetical protein